MVSGLQAIFFVTRRKQLIGIFLLGLLLFRPQALHTLEAGEILTLEQGIEIAIHNKHELAAAVSSLHLPGEMTVTGAK